MDRCSDASRYLIGTAGVVALIFVAVGLWTIPLLLEVLRRIRAEVREERQMAWRARARAEREPGRTVPGAPGMLSDLRFPDETPADFEPPTLRSEDFRR